MAKLSIGSWAYAFGPYEDNPVPFDVVVKTLSELGYDGVEIGGFKPHIHPDDYPMKKDRDAVRGLIDYYGLGVSGLAADFWGDPGPGTDEAQEDDAYFKLFKKNLQLCLDLGSKMIRVDTVSPPDEGVPGVDPDVVWNRIASLWHRCAELAQENGVLMTWEFEPGFMYNKPSEIVKMVEDVNHPNFKIMLDSCHAHMVAAVGARQPEPKEILKGGAVEFIEMLKGKIGHVHLIDSDETLHGDETSTHCPFGEGVLDFDEILTAIKESGFDGEWWTIDLCFWPEAWDVTEDAKKFLEPYIEKYG
ncbi:TIM barrel protein [Candidatus Poribacteria bacterium]|nr:TIM barrel protein [Candidatus Poribacteria bacterium]